MTEPNTPTKADILAAREIVKVQNNPAHWRAIDAGDWDNWGAIQAALADLIRRGESESEAE